ncbi:MAG: DUF4132 domain-containing protein [Deltaproteobacteria bacterium]|nr:DUF4132 domain-containing protein [Deltaproteobacteria bacterium]
MPKATKPGNAPRPKRSLQGSARPSSGAAVEAWVRKTYPSKPHGYWERTYAQLFEAGLRTKNAPELHDARVGAHALLSDYRNARLATEDPATLAVAERMVAHVSREHSLAPALATERGLADAVRIVLRMHGLGVDAEGGYTNAVYVTPKNPHWGRFGEPCAVLRHVVCAAGPAEYEAARDAASALREDRDWEDRAWLSYNFPDEPWGTADLLEQLVPSAEPRHGYWLLSATSDPAAVRRFVAAKGPSAVAVHALDLAASLPTEDAVAILGDALAPLLVKPKRAPLMKTPPRDVVAALATIDSPRVPEVLSSYLGDPVVGAMVLGYFRDHPEHGAALEARAKGRGRLEETAARVLGKHDDAGAGHDAMGVETEAAAREIPAVLRGRPWRAKKGTKKPPPIVVEGLAVLGTERERVELVAEPGELGLADARAMTDEELASWRAEIAKPNTFERCDFQYTGRGRKTEWLRVPEADGLAAWNERDAVTPTAGLLAWVARHGLATIPGFVRRRWLRWLDYEGSADVMHALTSLVSPRIAPVIATIAAQRKKHRRAALAWLRAHPDVAALGLVPVAVGIPCEAREDAEAALVWLSGVGHAELLRATASRYGDAALHAVDALLARDPLALDVKPPKPPGFLRESELPPLRARSGARLPDDAREALVEMLHVAPDDPRYVGLDRVRDACDPRSLGAIALGLLEQWVLGDAPGRAEWMLASVVHFPSPDAERRVASLAREWARKDAAKAARACRALAALGSDMALMHLAHIAETSRFEALRKEAAALVREAAEARGLTEAELADRTAPDAGLDADGSITLSYGTRSFRVTLDEALGPMVRERTGDQWGPRLKTLPRPSKNDDAKAAQSARARYDGLKDDLESIAKRQVRRFEHAMVEGRVWKRADFLAFVVGHPVSIHLASRLVWEQSTEAAGVWTSFRVAEDRTFADAADDPVELSADASVRIAHPARTPALASAWTGVFADYALVQPFEQLARATFAMTPDERHALAVARTATGPGVAARRILGTLESRGWRREHGGHITAYARDVRGRDGASLVARLPLTPGFSIDMLAHDAGQSLGALVVSRPADRTPLPIASLDPVSFSELLRDALSLGTGST